MVFHAVAESFQDDQVGVVEEAVQNGGSDGAVVVEDAGPLLEGFVGGQDNGTAFVTLADYLEKEIGAVLIYRKISDLVQNQYFGAQIFSEFDFKGVLFLGGAEMIDGINCIGKEDGVGFLTGGIAEGRGQVRLP